MAAWLGSSWQTMAYVVVSTVAVYCSALVAVRLAGRRTVAQLSAFDVVVTIALGSLIASTAVSRDPSYVQGMTAIVTLLALQVAAAALRQRFARMRRLLDSPRAWWHVTASWPFRPRRWGRSSRRGRCSPPCARRASTRWTMSASSWSSPTVACRWCPPGQPRSGWKTTAKALAQARGRHGVRCGRSHRPARRQPRGRRRAVPGCRGRGRGSCT